MKNLFAIIRISLVFAALGFCSTGSFAGTPWTWFGAWTNGTDTYYNVGFGIDDPSQASYSGATLSGGGLTSNGYFNGPGWETNIDFGSTQPSASIVYTGVVTAKSGVSTTTQFAQRATGFNVQYPTNIQPIGLVNDTNPVFTWSSPATQSSYVYGIDVAINTPWTPIWKQRNILGNTATYTGPALVPGTVYRVNVRTYEYDATNDSTYGAIRALLSVRRKSQLHKCVGGEL